MSGIYDSIRKENDLKLLNIGLKRAEAEIKDLTKYWNNLTYLDRNAVLGIVFDVFNIWKDQKIPSEIKPMYDNLYEKACSLFKANDENKPSLLDKLVSKLSNVKKEQEIPRARIIDQYILIIPNLPPDVRKEFELYFGIEKDLEKYGRKLIVYEKLLVEGGTNARYYAAGHCLLDLYEIYFRGS